jgi:predicted metal-dependent hydrolase
MLQRLRSAVEQPSIEQRRIQLAGQEVVYTLKRSDRRRSIGLRIDDQGLTVHLPQRATEKWLNSVLQEKASWVVEKLHGWQSRKPAPVLWVDGAAIPFMGEVLTLRVIPSLFAAPPQLHGGQLVVHVTASENQTMIERIVTQWYKREAERVFAECVDHFSPLMNVSPRELKLSTAHTQWGSCTARVVRLNWQLIKLKLDLVDYVVVHELAHLVEMNHSAAFWRVVERACPDYAERRKELKRIGIAE